MFSGLTNQVSNWMAKKPDYESPPPANAELDVNVEGDFDVVDKKDMSPTKGGSKLDMLAGVKSQMSGWLSSGIPGLSRGAAGAAEGEPAPEETSEIQTTNPTQVAENVKDDDASSATGGADSGPASLEGTPTEDKEGQQAFGAVSTKALAGAKSFGGFLYSAVNKAGKTVVEASVKIKKTVEENLLLEENVRLRLIAELNKESELDAGSKNAKEAVAPWIGAPNEDALREECLALSTERRNFVRSPPPGVDFDWDFNAIQPVAQATLAVDPNLESMRFNLVPKIISEEKFWRNYFYRVSLLRQNHELKSMASQAESNPNQTLTTSDSVDHTQADVITEQGTVENQANKLDKNSAMADSPSHEFISDSMRASNTDIEEVKEGMKKLGMQSPKAEEDWERELEAELNDFEVVPGQTKASDSGKDDWEEEIQDLLGDEEDLK